MGKGNAVRKRRWKRTACMGHTMRSADKHPCSTSRGKSLSIPWIACDRCYGDPISPYIFCWILTIQPVSGRDTESEWMKERDRQVGLVLQLNSWRESERIRERERRGQGRKLKPKGTNSAGRATQRIHLRVLSCPVCVSMETSLLSV